MSDFSQTQIPPGNKRDWLAVLFAMALPTFVTLAYFDWSEGFSPGVRQAIYLLSKGIQFGFPLLWVGWVQRRPLKFLRKSLSGVGLGTAFGIVILLVGVGLYAEWLKQADWFQAATEPIEAKIADLGLASAAKFVALGLFYSVFHSFLEEYYWRWFVFDQLRRLVSLWPAVIISSLGFMAHHILVIGDFFGTMSPATWLFSLAVATGGAFWAWIYARSDSLWGPWIGHAFVDAGIFAIGYDIASQLFQS